MVTSPEFLIPTQESTEHLSSEESRKYVSADAFVIKSETQTLAAKNYLFSGKAVRPTQIFDNTEDAILWLHKFRNEE